ncbi:VPLPA-CTERM sorting domain-containing protein [uncultured Thiocystis sp.]|jgi:hypothetical protein|uniref:VPLPA-CTERM sorting domain-containing protein n=1 Tax=uncultured Thiocystis sp. TaxID=1202134 RepID=UPI0025E248E8|nr:VPLPA-CTERM sorting domain-containing protein [uncultured Thiocystis sp.]
MKLATFALATALSVPGIAGAATFSGSFNLSGSAFSDPGLVIQVAPNPGNFTFDLDVGQSTTVDLFDIWTNEGSLQNDDLASSSIAAAFNFTNPLTSGNLSGTSFGSVNWLWLLQTQTGNVDWNNPLNLTFGSGGLLSITLNDADFNKGYYKLNPGRNNGATISATFTYSAAPVPLPAAVWLFGSALFGVAGIGYRRKPA